jgi:hypothetical protein
MTITAEEVKLGQWENAYDSPEKLGLEIFGAASDDDLSYEFDMFVVWLDAEGRLYYAYDSGCSCPSPFEDFQKVSDLCGPATAAGVQAALTEWAGSNLDKLTSAAALSLALSDL